MKIFERLFERFLGVVIDLENLVRLKSTSGRLNVQGGSEGNLERQISSSVSSRSGWTLRPKGGMRVGSFLKMFLELSERPKMELKAGLSGFDLIFRAYWIPSFLLLR